MAAAERPRPRRPAAPTSSPETASAGPDGTEPPPCHIDLCAIDGAWLVVMGWVVRAAGTEPEVALLLQERRVKPLVQFARPDVIEFFEYARASHVRRGDIAFSFVAAVASSAPRDVRLLLQGHARPLQPIPPPPGRDPAFLDRYVEALADLAASPAIEASRRALQSARIRAGAARPAAEPEKAGPDPFLARPETPVSVDDLLNSCRAEGPLFAAGRARAACGPMLALFAIHQRGAFLTHHHHAMLSALRKRGCRIVLVNSSPGSAAGSTALREDLVDGAILRTDHGRDVASWLLALQLLGDRAADAGHIVFCNDSFFGPFDDLASMFAHHAESEADFWALTDSWEHGWHAQSSFFILSARALTSDAMARFRAEYGYPDAREAVVRQGEIGLSRLLAADRSLSIGIVAAYSRLARETLDAAPALLRTLAELPEHAHRDADDADGARTPETAARFLRALLFDLRHGVPRNPQHVFWRQLLRVHRIPFVKRELLHANPARVPDYWRILPTVADLYGAAQAARVEADMRLGATRAPVA